MKKEKRKSDQDAIKTDVIRICQRNGYGTRTGEVKLLTEGEFEQQEIREEMPPQRKKLVWRKNSHKRRMCSGCK